MSKYIESIEIPKKYDTLEKKLSYIQEKSESLKKRDIFDMDYTFRLYLTKQRLIDNL